jgi:tRNA(Ile)-lysidine synthase TilS/MesJ
MDSIIINPLNNKEYKEILKFLKSNNIDFEIYENPTKEQILNSIEQGFKELKLYKEGKIKLQDTFELLNEL